LHVCLFCGCCLAVELWTTALIYHHYEPLDLIPTGSFNFWF
jgi:hypothetical protein